jgi:uncharacterized protein (TIGR02271 family)
MKKELLVLYVLPAAAVLLAGCCSSGRSAGRSPPAQAAQGGAATTERGVAVVAGTGAVETLNEADIALHKEELVVSKKEVSNGGVLIRTVVQSENVSQPVQLQREEYVIERIPAAEAKQWEGKAGVAFQGREVYIPLMREEAVAAIRPLLTESVQIVKQTETDRITVKHPVRSEDVQITKVAGPPAPAYGIVSGQTAAAAPSELDLNKIQLAREELIVGKRNVESGGVKLMKVIRTEEASQPLEVQRQEFAVNRTPLGDKPAEKADFSQREIRMGLTREEPVVGTRNYLAEVVRVRKQIHTDDQTIAGVVRKENVEIVKLTAEQAAMGGTGSPSATGIISESGPGKVTTLTGTIMCARCQLQETDVCQNVLQVQDGAKTQTYYIAQNDASKAFHQAVCKDAKKATATGTVQEVNGKLQFTATKIELAD